jgi:hypothetical protein
LATTDTGPVRPQNWPKRMYLPRTRRSSECFFPQKKKKAFNVAVAQRKKQAAEVPCNMPFTTDVPFRLSCKTLDTSYVHRHFSPSLLASIQSALLAPLPPPQTALPSDDDNGPLPESRLY